MSSIFTRRKFIRLAAGGVIASTMGYRLGRGANVAPDTDITKRLGSFQGKFRFAIIADTHLVHPDNPDLAPVRSRENLQRAVAEINAMSPEPAFVLHIGDLGNVADTPSLDNWLSAVEPLKPLSLLVHGNHDGEPPYEKFTAYEDKVNHLTSVFYSFDCAGWHFVAIPCNLNGNAPVDKNMAESMLAFLEKDLDQNKGKPTILFQHLHFLPTGLAQNEWYFYRLDIRKRLRELYTKHGNIKWAFNGHVHNGIKASVKTSWNYQGMRFVNCPTVIVGRPYGEEVPGFEKGLMDGGYYLIVEVDGEKVSLQGRLAGVGPAYDYPETFQVFTDEVEPKLFHLIGELPVSPTLANGNFADGLKGWMLPFRYMRDKDPVFVAEVGRKDGASAENALHLTTKSGGLPLIYAGDEYYEAAQICALAPGDRPLVSASYRVPEEPAAGGGFLRLEVLHDLALKYLLMFHWGNHEENCVYFPVCVNYALTGGLPSWTPFPKLAEKKKAFFWRIPMTPIQWHDLKIDVAGLVDQAVGQTGAFSRHHPDKIRVVVGTWNDRTVGTLSRASFAGIALEKTGQPTSSTVDGLELADANAGGVLFGMSRAKRY